MSPVFRAVSHVAFTPWKASFITDVTAALHFKTYYLKEGSIRLHLRFNVFSFFLPSPNFGCLNIHLTLYKLLDRFFFIVRPTYDLNDLSQTKIVWRGFCLSTALWVKIVLVDDFDQYLCRRSSEMP